MLEPWKQTYLVGWFLAVGCVHLPFLHCLHLHHLFHILLHKSGSQQNRVLLLIRTRYEEDKEVHLIPFYMPFNSKNCNLQFRLKGTTTRKHSLNLKCIEVCINFSSTNALQMLVMTSSIQIKAFSLEKILNVLHRLVND